MGIIINENAKKSWLVIKYTRVSTSNVGSTFNIIFSRTKLKKYGYCKVFTYKDKVLKGKVFLIAIEGDEYHSQVKKHFGILETIVPPNRAELTRVCGSTIEHEWMFSNLK